MSAMTTSDDNRIPVAVTGKLGVLHSGESVPAEWESWLTFAAADDGADLLWLREEIGTLRRHQYVGVLVCESASGTPGWINVVCGDTSVEIVREALMATGEFCLMGNPTPADLVELCFEPWCHDSEHMLEARAVVDAEIMERSSTCRMVQ